MGPRLTLCVPGAVVGGPCLAGGMAAAEGYDSDFLPTSVPLPTPSGGGESVRLLPFTHFSVVLALSRRLAVVTIKRCRWSGVRSVVVTSAVYRRWGG